ncbi:hypothetical protein GRX01_01750 [Halobaculum sp. WSA2]|uniref:AAA domain-containing protein n=1 Tax=Halobaculum saliterrae TaxID=2073113 RepID=A0A6B0SMX7_9EURY|nr:hypothetical protein [Halobaculum saliterrae]MXR40085.1 hypothetical protein [Halobaculum saliterrae]
MRIKTLDIEEFASGEHRGKTVQNVQGDSFLFRGGSRTGKTLTFNAILYNLLGARHTVDLATGRQNEVELRFTNGTRFFRGNPRAEFENGGEVLTGGDASDEFSELLGDTDLIKSHFVHSHLGKMPLDDLGKDDRISLIRAVTNDELRQRLSRFEDAEEQLEELVIETEDEKRRATENLEEIQREIQSLESQKEKYEDIESKIDSGELADLSERLLRDEDLESRLDQLFREKEGLRKQLRKLHRKKRKQQNYDSEVNQIIAEAVNDFVCPTCDRRITTEKAKNRIQTGNCPYCGRDHSLEGLKEQISERINRSDDLLSELETEIEELQSQRDQVDQDIEKIRDDRPEIGDLDGFVKRRLDRFDHDLDLLRDHVEEELENVVQSLEEARAEEQRLQEKQENAEDRLEAYQESLVSASEQVEELTQESFEAGIQEFSEKWEEIYNEMNSSLELEIDIDPEGTIQFPGRNNVREYDRGGNLSGSELHLLNISFACTLAMFATESEATEWDTVVLDEPFSNLQEPENREAAIEYILSMDKQVIATSSDDSLDGRFENVEVLSREALQTRLGEFT